MKRNLFPAILLCALFPLMSGMSCGDLLPDGEEDFPDYVMPDPDEPDDPNNPDNPDEPAEPDRIAHDWSWWQNYQWEAPDDYEPDITCGSDIDDCIKRNAGRVKIPSDFPRLLSAIADKEFVPSDSRISASLYPSFSVHPDGIFLKDKDGEEYCFLHVTQWWLNEPEAHIRKRIGISVYDTAYFYTYVGEAWQVVEVYERKKRENFRDTLVSRVYVRDAAEVFATFPKSLWQDDVVYSYEKEQWHTDYNFPLEGFYGTRRSDGMEVFSDTLPYPLRSFKGYMTRASWYYPRL
jgi:hypothetical protein